MTQKPDADGWTPERIAAAKADPKQNDPRNWAANPQLDDEDEAILTRVDQERVAEALVEKALQKKADRKDRFVSDADDGGMVIKPPVK